MKKYIGKGVCQAIAMGPAYRYRKTEMTVRREHVLDCRAEEKRLREAIESAKEELDALYTKAVGEIGMANAQIFEAHKMMLEDDAYLDSILNIIETEEVNAEYAVAITSDYFAEMFSGMEDAYMQARAVDVRDISNRLIQNLYGSATIVDKTKGILCATDLSPSETILFDKETLLAMVTAHGSANSHTAILARSRNIAAVVGVGEDFLEAISEGTEMIVDGFSGVIYIEPDEATQKKYEALLQKERDEQRLLEELKGKETITLDGVKIALFANIGSAEELGDVLKQDAEGIGLFRSEFLYLGRNTYPSEEEQFQVYKKILTSMAGKKVIIRTLDIGADKQADYFQLDKEENPALGFRAIRLCLSRPELFRTQLRALYRASVYGTLGILFPMITDPSEVTRIRTMCEEVQKELCEYGVVCAKKVELGIMIETPAAAILSDQLAQMVDFFSIGTNDLTQYTLACDRQNPHLEAYCNPRHPAILRLIQTTVEHAHQHGIWVGICGELAADTKLTEFFLHIGVDELSVSPSLLLSLRKKIRSMNLKELPCIEQKFLL